MRHGRLMAFVVSLAAGLAAASMSQAQAPLACSAQTVGMQVCQTGTICKCGFSPGGTMTMTPAGYNWSCDIAYGSCPQQSVQIPLTNTLVTARAAAGGRSTDARAVQEALRGAGFDPGPSDGVMGPRTRQAIREWQRSQDLKITGALGPDDLKKLGL